MILRENMWIVILLTEIEIRDNMSPLGVDKIF